MIKRLLAREINKRLGSGKAIIVLGPRQTGKTTLLSSIAQAFEQRLLLNCDESLIRQRLASPNLQTLKTVIGKHGLVLIDEAQRVAEIGLTLKLIIDQFPNVQLLVSGSSALELANTINEPLTGRKWEYHLYPICWQELENHYGVLDAERQLEQRLIYGCYPDIVTSRGDEAELLTQLTGSYLYKDLLSWEGIRKPQLLEKLLQALALQIGNEVSFNELASLLQVNKNTVQQYIALLEKAYVVFRLNPLSRNLRNEISSSRKIYFWDNGIRNSLIANYNPLSLRQDTGALWENFLVSERFKIHSYQRISANAWFWRTHARQEIDYIEESGGKIRAFEFKWNPKAKVKPSTTFCKAYPESEFMVVHRDNFRKFLVG